MEQNSHTVWLRCFSSCSVNSSSFFFFFLIVNTLNEWNSSFLGVSESESGCVSVWECERGWERVREWERGGRKSKTSWEIFLIFVSCSNESHPTMIATLTTHLSSHLPSAMTIPHSDTLSSGQSYKLSTTLESWYWEITKGSFSPLFSFVFVFSTNNSMTCSS